MNLPDGGQTVVQVPPHMSMGELLFYIAEKRGLDVGDMMLAESTSGR